MDANNNRKGPCIGSDGKPDLAAPVDVDFTCLKLLGLTGDLALDLGPGLNIPLNQLLDDFLINYGIHAGNLVYPCLKCAREESK